MPRRSKPGNLESLRLELVKLLKNFRRELTSPDLRRKVRSLVPAFHLLRDLGCSLIPKETAASARDRILYYLRKYPGTVISGDELMVVSGIAEWPRRLRELRVEFGWAIVSGITAKEMAAEGEFSIRSVTPSKLRPDDYVLVSSVQDRDAAHRWNLANEIRGKTASVRDKILEFLRKNAGKSVSGEELRYVANDRTEWARRTRELRTEFGWPILTKATGRPDLDVGSYVLAQDRQSPAHDRRIPDSVRRTVLIKSNYRCSNCQWHHALSNPSDPRHLELHHVQQHAHGGKNTPENLIVLCTACHDEIHRQSHKRNKR